MNNSEKTSEELLVQTESLQRRIDELEANVQGADHHAVDADISMPENRYKISESKNEQLQNINQEHKTFFSLFGQCHEHAGLFEFLAEKIPIAFAVSDAEDQRLLFHNWKWAKIFGYDPSEISTKAQWWRLAYPDPEYRQHVLNQWDMMAQASAQKQAVSDPIETVVRCKDGSEKNIQWGFASIGPYNIIWAIDRTGRHRLQQERSDIEQKFRLAFENANVGICLVDLNGILLEVNSKMSEILGYEASELEGRSVNERAHPEDVNVSPQHIKEALSGTGAVFEFEKRFFHKNGQIVFTKVSSSLATDARGNPLYFISHVMDISEAKRAEEKLRRSEQRFRLMFEKNEAVMLLIEPDTGLIIDTNDAACNFYGYPRDVLQKMNISEINCLSWNEISEAIQQILDGEKNYFTFPHRLSNGSVRTVELYSSTIELDGKILLSSVIHDISDRIKAEREKRDLQSQLFQAQKTQALGTLVGGIAHDFNNMLQIICGYSELLMSRFQKSDEVFIVLKKILDTSQGGAELVKKLLAFGQQSPRANKPMNLNDELFRLGAFVADNLPPNIEMEMDLTDGDTTIRADFNLINQILINLVSNACESMPDGGRLKISTGAVKVEQQGSASDLQLNPGQYITLSVEDTGRGMDDETLGKIFDPFFSTKQRGATRGTGLGLSVVQGMVQQLKGAVTCKSSVGKGSEFRVYLPVFESEPTTSGACLQ